MNRQSKISLLIVFLISLNLPAFAKTGPAANRLEPESPKEAAFQDAAQRRLGSGYCGL
jgi:hypothetical protein